jgi:predicted glycoside hydrolase/deacetylase ChbG (UPF0249 family)
MTRRLIVNADDFGRSAGINRGVAAAYEVGIVSSASLMVRWPAAAGAAAYASAHPDLGVGLHIDLGEWEIREGEWAPVYEVPGDPVAQLRMQLDLFRSLLRRDPTHLDSHQHVHRHEPLRSAVTALAIELGVPARELVGGVAYYGSFYGQDGHGQPYPDGIALGGLLESIERLPPGVAELGCHPGLDEDDYVSMYRRERAVEVEVLCDPRVRAAIEHAGITLSSFEGLDVSVG